MATDSATDTRRLKAILTLAAALGFVGFSYTAPEFRGYTPAQLPLAEVRPAVQPAGFAFAIWGVIYAWLVVSAGFGLLKRAEAPDWDAHRWPLIAGMGLGAGWLYVAVTDALAATVMIWAMLALALRALARTPRRDPWLARVPVGLFAGWLTAAACVSLGVWLAGTGIVASSRAAALMMVPLAAAIALLVLLRLPGTGGYAIAAGWGLFGIAVQNWGRNTDLTALALLAILALGAVWWTTRRRRA